MTAKAFTPHFDETGQPKKLFSSPESRPTLAPIQLPIQWVPGALSQGVKWPGSEADHSPPISAEVRNSWIHTSIPQYALMGGA